MPLKHQIHKLCQLIFSKKSPHSNHFLPKPLPTATPLTTPESPESADLPTWHHNNKTPEFPDGDFVIPEHQNLGNSKEVGNPLLFEAQVSDIDRVSEILSIHYTSMDSVVQALNGCGVNPTKALISQLLNRFSNDWVPAFGVFTWAKYQTGYVHSPDLYDLMVDILGRQRKFSLMWDLVKEMDNLKGYISLATMTKVFRRLAKAGNFQDAIEAFRGMENFGVSKDTEALNVLLDELVKYASLDHAYSVFMEFKGSTHVDSRSYNIFINGYCKERKFNDARKIMDEMEKNGFQSNVAAYNCFIDSYCKLKDFQNVLAVFTEMQEKGCKPDVISYTIFMQALGKAKQVDKALDVYEIMKSNGCVPDSCFYGSLISILTVSGRLKEASDIFEDMKRQGVKPHYLMYNSMIASACNRLEEENSFKLLRRMEEDSCKPDIHTYAPLLKLCCRKKRIKELKFLLNHMFKNSISIDLSTYGLLVVGLCKIGELELACSFFEEMILKGMIPRDHMYQMLVEELNRKSLTEAKEKIQKLLLQAKEQTAI